MPASLGRRAIVHRVTPQPSLFLDTEQAGPKKKRVIPLQVKYSFQKCWPNAPQLSNFKTFLGAEEYITL